MRKIIIIFALLITMFIFADEVTLKDGGFYQCEIVAKQGNSLFISFDDQIFKVKQSDISEIIDNGSVKTALIFKRKDFGNVKDDVKALPMYSAKDQIQISQPDQHPLFKANYPIDIVTQEQVDLLQMTEREFEIYKFQQEQRKLDELINETNDVSSTIWHVYLVSIASAIGVSIIMSNSCRNWLLNSSRRFI